jgi:hypothetical protein
METVSAQQFAARFVALVLDGRGLPRKPADLDILLQSTVLSLEPGRPYTETELNDELQRWILEFGQHLALDHVTLRRFLVDGNFVRRDSAGTEYEIVQPGEGRPYSPDIRSLDLRASIDRAKADRQERKRRFAGGGLS